MVLLSPTFPLLLAVGAASVASSASSSSSSDSSSRPPTRAISLPFSRKIVDGPSASYTRRQHGLRRRASSGLPVPIYDAQSHMLYLMDVQLGSPAQKFSLQIDTGSSDLWVPSADASVCRVSGLCSNGAYSSEKSDSFIDVAENEFQIAYVDGTQIAGDYFTDTLALGKATLKNQTMALAMKAVINCNVCPFQGIIGIGYPAGESIVHKEGLDAMYPNVVSELKSQGYINTLSYSLWLNDLDSSSGEVLFGAVDRKKYTGDLVSLPVISTAGMPKDVFVAFTVVLDGLSVVGRDGKQVYSRSNLSMPVILDSGTSLTYLDDKVASEIDTGVGVVNHPQLDKIVPCSLAKSNATFNFRFGNSKGPVIKVPIRQFVLPFPAGFNVPACQWGIYGSGNDPNLFGDTFLRSAYVVYDLENNQVAVAQALHDVNQSDVVEIKSQIPGVKSTASVGASVVATKTATAEQKDPSNRPASVSSGVSTTTGTFDLGSSNSTGNGKSAASLTVRPSTGLVSVLAAAFGWALLRGLVAL